MSIAPGTALDGIRDFAGLRDRCWVDPDTNCWHWRKGCDGNGNPNPHCPALGRCVTLGQLICILKTGAKAAPGRLWYVACDTKNCANPSHRKEGTQKDAQRHRQLTPVSITKLKLTKRARSKVMTEELAAEIRLSTDSAVVIGKRHDINPGFAWKIKTGRAWAPINLWCPL